MVVKEAIYRIFLDAYGRPKITPRHESAIQVFLEENYTPTQVKTGLNNLEKKGILGSRRIQIGNVGKAKFYFLKLFDKDETQIKINEKIIHYGYWIQRYSDVKVLKMIGEHLQDLVKAELRAQNFQIEIEKNVKEYEGKKWPESHSLDLIAKHKQKGLVLGLEVKNTLYPTPKSEVSTKIEMCKFWGIKPVFATRWLEIHREIINDSGGFLWQFKNQIYPRGQENFVKQIGTRFKLPVEIRGTLPPFAIKDFKNWIFRFLEQK